MNNLDCLCIAVFALAVPTLTVQVLLRKKIITPRRARRYICFKLMPWLLLMLTMALVIEGLCTIAT